MDRLFCLRLRAESSSIWHSITSTSYIQKNDCEIRPVRKKGADSIRSKKKARIDKKKAGVDKEKVCNTKEPEKECC